MNEYKPRPVEPGMEKARKMAYAASLYIMLACTIWFYWPVYDEMIWPPEPEGVVGHWEPTHYFGVTMFLPGASDGRNRIHVESGCTPTVDVRAIFEKARRCK